MKNNFNLCKIILIPYSKKVNFFRMNCFQSLSLYFFKHAMNLFSYISSDMSYILIYLKCDLKYNNS